MNVIIQRSRAAHTWTTLGSAAWLLALLVGCGARSPEPESPPQPAAETLPAPPPVLDEVVEKKDPAPAIAEESFGEVDGKPITLYTLTNADHFVLKAMNYGAIITELHLPDADGHFDDVVLGYDRLEDYVAKTPYFGATIGRVANRIKNAQFELEGKKYKLNANDGPNALHGGEKGWDKVVWEAEAKQTDDGPQVVFRYTSPDGEEGYPGTVHATTIYTLTNDNELEIVMRATTDETTLVNMAHHSYWNLGGQASGTILDHELTIFADFYTPAPGLVPTGEIKPVKGTPFDFTSPKRIGKDLKAAGGEPMGYDHNWIVNGDPRLMRPFAKLVHPQSGRVLYLSANQPGLQFYSGNFLDGTLAGKGGYAYPQYSGLCLESQKFPNSVNVPAWREDVVLKPGQVYEHKMVHKFAIE